MEAWMKDIMEALNDAEQTDNSSNDWEDLFAGLEEDLIFD
jgi:hypothetical protein